MLNDIVIDTNVLVHANNKAIPQSKYSIRLIEELLDCGTKLCVDPGFSAIEADNRSQIGGEYFSKLHYGMLGYTFIIQLASQRRVKEVDRSISIENDNLLRDLGIPSVDRLFVKIASNSTERLLISHDENHFSERNREVIQTDLLTRILEAYQVIGLFEE